jgi:signal peptidase II
MNRREWSIHLGIVFGLLVIDQITKIYAEQYIMGLKFYGPFGLVLHQNPGAMLGAFSDLPPLLRVVSLSTGGAFLLFIYLALQHLIPMAAKILRFGMSILLGGILGNVTDRIFQGTVTDFLLVGTVNQATPAFNVADMVQWVGYFMIVYSLIRDGSQFWPEQNFRKRIWVNPSFQTKYVLLALALGLGFTLIYGVFFFTYLKVTIDSLVIGSAPAIERKFLLPFIITFGIIASAFVLMIFILARILSHRVAGPLYAFEKFLEDILSGKDRDLKLRQGDEFRHLEDMATKLRTHFKNKSGTNLTDEEIAQAAAIVLPSGYNPFKH